MSTDRLPLITPEELQKPIQMRPANWRKPDVDARGLWAELRRNVEGEVRFDAGSISMYSMDASNYQQYPTGVVIPKSKEDVIQTLAACRKFGSPVLSRGGGTSLAGQTCNYGIVIDFTKYLNSIVEVNPHQRYARVLPGCIRDTLANAVAKYTLTFGPDPATHSRCVFGGMIANNSCGAHAQFGGKAVDNTEELEIVLYDGTRMNVGWMTNADLDAAAQRPGREGDIYSKLRSLRDRYARLIKENYPTIPRRVSGYNLDQLIPGEDGRFNVARALVGTEGTCVTYLEAKVRLIYSHPERVVLMLGYPDAYHAADHLMEVLEFNPIALEGIDHRLRDYVIKKGGPHKDFVPLLPEGNGWLMVEFGCDTEAEASEQARKLMERLKSGSNPPSMRLFVDKEDQLKIWKLRESGLGATAFVPGEPPTHPGWEDSAIAPKDVGSYLRELRGLFEKYRYNPALYGHFGMGCIHCRVDFDLRTTHGVEQWKSFMEEATDLVDKYKGSYSGEHGDGQARAQYLHKMFGPELVEAFREFKSIWDPDWKMNPGKVVDPYHVDENLKQGPAYDPWEPQTHFRFPRDHGSFSYATSRCVGVGKCRRLNGETNDDTMCPSFMVTREEKHSTRGRAHLLWDMMNNGGPLKDRWRSEDVKEALDLCLSCKGCKGDCPVNVDVATYKAEFLSHYFEGRLRPRSAYAFGLIDQWARVASRLPGLANLFTQLPGLSAIAKLAAGVPQSRQIPAFAPETFRAWFKKRGEKAGGKRVILWADTFNNYFLPQTAQAALDVLEAGGFQVSVPMQHLCCGRPLYDYGFLDLAKSYLHKILRELGPEIDAGTPMIVLEPSCCSVFRDELLELLPEEPRAKNLASQTFTLAEYLTQHADGYTPPQLRRKALIQGHCHHKAVMRFKGEEALMTKMKLDYKLLDSGCCGMAGGFGYEKDKYDISLAAGERVLLPKVRKAEVSSIIMADGFSCKSQIEQETNRHALHLAEVMQIALNEGEHGGSAVYPEGKAATRRQAAVKKSMIRAGITAGAIVGGVLALLLVRRSAHSGGRD